MDIFVFTARVVFVFFLVERSALAHGFGLITTAMFRWDTVPTPRRPLHVTTRRIRIPARMDLIVVLGIEKRNNVRLRSFVVVLSDRLVTRMSFN